MESVPQKTCTKCGQSKPVTEFYKERRNQDGHGAQCAECVKQRVRLYHAQNPEANRRRAASYRKAISDGTFQRKRLVRDTTTMIETNKARSLAYYYQHKPRIVERKQTYHQEHPEVARVANHRRRALKQNQTGRYTAKEWRSMKEHYNHYCLRCGLSEPSIQLTADHVIPLSLSGTNTIENIQPLCLTCNLSKGNRNTIDYRLTTHVQARQSQFDFGS